MIYCGILNNKGMKQTLLKSFMATTLLLVGSQVANTEDFQIDGIYYSLRTEDLTAQVIRTPEAAGKIVLPHTVNYGDKAYALTNISDGAVLSTTLVTGMASPKTKVRRCDFSENWMFRLGNANSANFDDTSWRVLNLPHDWAIEGSFDKNNPAGFNGGALPGGLGWYRKAFRVSEADKGKKTFIDFDGAYMNTTVYLNGDSIGFWPYGYSSFRFDLTPYLKYGTDNVIAVKVDNSKQPNSRWYSGIYRNVWLTVVDPIHVDQWGTYVTTPEVTREKATFSLRTMVKNDRSVAAKVQIISHLLDGKDKEVGRSVSFVDVPSGEK